MTRKDFAPTDGSSRIAALDVVRGMALFGVLAMNIVTLAGTRGASSTMDGITVFLRTAFIEGKSVSIFSMLFGIGIFMQMERGLSKRADFGRFTFRRMVMLFLIGSLHWIAIFHGDILLYYAMVGMLLILLEQASPKVYIASAFIVFLLFEGFDPFITHFHLNPNFIVWNWSEKLRSLSAQVYSGGTYLDCVKFRASLMFNGHFMAAKTIDTIGFTMPMFLLGGAIWKSRILMAPEKRTTLLRVFHLTFWLGLLVNVGGGLLNSFFKIQVPMFIGDVGIYALALGYATGTWAFLTSNTWSRVAKPFYALSSLGRMALTNYMGYSLVLSCGSGRAA